MRPLGLVTMAAAGTTVASFSTRTVMLVLTYWPGHNSLSLLSNCAFARTTPTLGSTVLSTKVSVPFSGSGRPGIVATTGDFAFAASSRSCRRPSGTGKVTAIGSSCVTVTSVIDGDTRVPAKMGIAPVRPAIGARISSSLNATCAACTAARSAAAAARGRVGLRCRMRCPPGRACGHYDDYGGRRGDFCSGCHRILWEGGAALQCIGQHANVTRPPARRSRFTRALHGGRRPPAPRDFDAHVGELVGALVAGV